MPEWATNPKSPRVEDTGCRSESDHRQAGRGRGPSLPRLPRLGTSRSPEPSRGLGTWQMLPPGHASLAALPCGWGRGGPSGACPLIVSLRGGGESSSVWGPPCARLGWHPCSQSPPKSPSQGAAQRYPQGSGGGKGRADRWERHVLQKF